MKILVTGGSGFIGTNVVEYYINKGFDVLNIDINAPKIRSAYIYWKKCDFRIKSDVVDIISGFNPDFIIHLGARTDLDGKSVEDYDSNTIGVENVLYAASLLKSLKKILITSSMLVCRVGYKPKNQFDYCPTTLYGESKVLTEKLTWDNKLGCDWAILRPTSIWGAWFGVPYRNFFDMIKGHMYFHIGYKSCVKTYGYIENAVYQIDRILLSDTSDKSNKVFYLGDTPATNIEEWANEIAKGCNVKLFRVPYCIVKIAAWFGDFLSVLGIHFPMTSFRLKNMTTDNVVDLSNTYQVAPNPPVDRISAVHRTLKWMNNNIKG